MRSENGHKEGKFALVLVDIQRKFSNCSDVFIKNTEGKMDTINAAIELFRETDNPIIYVYYDGDTHECTGYIENGDEWTEGLLTPREQDKVVYKSGMNSFRSPELEPAIKDAGCTKVLIAGMVSQYCVLATYFGASDVDLLPFMLEGGTVATDEANVKAVEQICRTVTVDMLKENENFRK